MPRGDISIIPNGFAPAEFNLKCRSERDAHRAEMGYEPSDRVVISVANELERKGFGPLLRAIGRIDDPRVHLLAVGRLDASAYAREAEALGLSERIRFIGPSRDVASFYAVADVFALPSNYEAWGLVIVEAMVCGLPVLTSRLAGASVVVREGETGTLVDNPHDDAEIAAKLAPLVDGHTAPAEEIALSVAPYTWSNILRKYEAQLFRLAGRA